jgi:hypothetical protein
MKPYYEQSGITIYHADCRDVIRAIGLDWAFGAIVSDPPYGQSFVTNYESAFRGVGIAGDMDTSARDYLVDVAVARNVPAIIFGSWKIARPSKALRQVLVWDKGEHAGGLGDLRSPWKSTHEEIYIVGDGLAVGESLRRGSVLSYSAFCGTFAVNVGGRSHPTEKPESLMLHLVSRCPVAPRDLVLDAFMGSGTTLVACKRLGRSAIGIEIEERYCEIAAKRLQQEALPFGAEVSPPASDGGLVGVDVSKVPK